MLYLAKQVKEYALSLHDLSHRIDCSSLRTDLTGINVRNLECHFCPVFCNTETIVLSISDSDPYAVLLTVALDFYFPFIARQKYKSA